MEALAEIFKRHSIEGKGDVGCADKGTIHSYIETYEKILEPYRDGCYMMEIGVALGHSIRMWDEYFKDSSIIGVDISLMVEPFKGKNYNEIVLIEANATHESFLKMIGHNKFHIIIDDGSHITNDQIATFELLKGRMNKGGVYIIEDILALDIERKRFEALHNNIEIVDMRHTGRFDNILLIFRF